jgi:hypothetical protein
MFSLFSFSPTCVVICQGDDGHENQIKKNRNFLLLNRVTSTDLNPLKFTLFSTCFKHQVTRKKADVNGQGRKTNGTRKENQIRKLKLKNVFKGGERK